MATGMPVRMCADTEQLCVDLERVTCQIDSLCEIVGEVARENSPYLGILTMTADVRRTCMIDP